MGRYTCSTPPVIQGHLSFYDPVSRTLLSGDAVVLEKCALKLHFPQFSFDVQEARKSITTISALPMQRIVCYHGRILTRSEADIKAQLQAAVMT